MILYPHYPVQLWWYLNLFFLCRRRYFNLSFRVNSTQKTSTTRHKTFPSDILKPLHITAYTLSGVKEDLGIFPYYSLDIWLSAILLSAFDMPESLLHPSQSASLLPLVPSLFIHLHSLQHPMKLNRSVVLVIFVYIPTLVRQLWSYISHNMLYIFWHWLPVCKIFIIFFCFNNLIFFLQKYKTIIIAGNINVTIATTSSHLQSVTTKQKHISDFVR